MGKNFTSLTQNAGEKKIGFRWSRTPWATFGGGGFGSYNIQTRCVPTPEVDLAMLMMNPGGFLDTQVWSPRTPYSDQTR